MDVTGRIRPDSMDERKLIMARSMSWHIDKDGQGMGGFLAPPGHHSLTYTLWFGWTKRNAKAFCGLDGALDPAQAEMNEIPASIVASAQRIVAASVLACSEPWMRHVYQYMRSMYAPESGTRDVSKAVSDRTNGLPAERHLGFLAVRAHFPDHEPRVDLITGDYRGYGSWPCVHCGKRVQYEPRIDGFQPFNGDRSCSDGNVHTW